ncbi:MAG: hypothetical protein JNK47_10780 [Mesorhizobium sp.]|nr:hypothetical protein [Mesorhizobium sp.]
MTVREAALQAVGVDVHASSSDRNQLSGLPDIYQIPGQAFSGYGEFTPITVRSDTVISDAHLERHQRRD